jgi:hypothetical protein
VFTIAPRRPRPVRPFDVVEEAAAVTERWFNQTLTTGL